MNSKTMKKIRHKSLDILSGWVKTLVSEDEKSKVNRDNVEQFLAQQEYIYKHKTLYLSVYSKRWVISVLKKMVSKGVPLESIDYEYFSDNYVRYLHGQS